MKARKLYGCIVAGSLVLSTIAGCGRAEQPDVGTTENTGTDTSGASAKTQGNEDIIELKLVLMSQGNVAGWDAVEDEINRIAEQEIGVRIDAEWIELGSWNQQMNLKMSSQEEMDLVMLTPLMTFANLQSANQLLDITDELKEYGQDILATAGDYLEATTVDGQIYGVPNYSPKGGKAYILMRTDALEELGIYEQAKSIKSWADYEAILETVKAQTDYVPLYCIGQTGYGTTIAGKLDLSENDFSAATCLESGDDPFGLINIDPDTNEVYSYFMSDTFKADIARAADFYQKGYMYKDGSSSDSTATDMFTGNVIFSTLNMSEPPKIEENIEASVNGMDMTVVEICDVPVTRSGANMWGYGVAYTSKNPEAAVEFLNLMYTNEELANLFIWGIEGRDHIINDDGTVSKTENTQYECETFFYGNPLLARPQKEKGADYNELCEEAIGEQLYSKYMGFVCDTEPITNALTACYNAKLEYMPSLICGSSGDWEADYEAFVQKLEDCGIEDVISYYQEQLDAWLATQE